jgi:hypothetical protein
VGENRPIREDQGAETYHVAEKWAPLSGHDAHGDYISFLSRQIHLMETINTHFISNCVHQSLFHVAYKAIAQIIITIFLRKASFAVFIAEKHISTVIVTIGRVRANVNSL